MKRFFLGIWLWLKKNPLALVAALSSALGAFLVYRSTKNKVASLEDALEVEAGRRRIAGREAEAKLLRRQAEEKEPEIQKAEKKIAESKRRVMEIEQGQPLEDKSDAEIAKAFTDAGF